MLTRTTREGCSAPVIWLALTCHASSGGPTREKARLALSATSTERIVDRDRPVGAERRDDIRLDGDERKRIARPFGACAGEVVHDPLLRAEQAEPRGGESVEKTGRVANDDGQRGTCAGPEERTVARQPADLDVDVERELLGPAGKRNLGKPRPALRSGASIAASGRLARSSRNVTAPAVRFASTPSSAFAPDESERSRPAR